MKNIIFLLLTIALTTKGFGQQTKLNIGLEGGPSLIFLNGNATEKNNSGLTVGYSGGIAFQYNFGSLFSIRTNVDYERKGAYATITISDPYGNKNTGKNHLNLNYLTAPILLRASFGNKGNILFNAGVFFGYLINQTTSFQSSAHSYNYSSTDNTSNYKSFDTGLSAGLGFSIPIYRHFLFSFEARNNTGILNIEKPVANSNPVLRTNSTNLLLGIVYKLGSQ